MAGASVHLVNLLHVSRFFLAPNNLKRENGVGRDFPFSWDSEEGRREGSRALQEPSTIWRIPPCLAVKVMHFLRFRLLFFISHSQISFLSRISFCFLSYYLFFSVFFFSFRVRFFFFISSSHFFSLLYFVLFFFWLFFLVFSYFFFSACSHLFYLFFLYCSVVFIFLWVSYLLSSSFLSSFNFFFSSSLLPSLLPT